MLVWGYIFSFFNARVFDTNRGHIGLRPCGHNFIYLVLFRCCKLLGNKLRFAKLLLNHRLVLEEVTLLYC